ncbi:MAG: hypothetical protein HY326_06970 [Chloroflexi bacterium]|nr:hypothetical protein [Chloroflexota bacterium]
MLSTTSRRVFAAVAVGLVLLAVGALAATAVLAQGPNPWGGRGPGGMMGGQGSYGPGGMMGGQGNSGGMMGGQGSYGPGSMMQGWNTPNTGTPLTLDQAVEKARQYISSYNNPDLVLTEVMEFDNGFYAEAKEQSTGGHAFEFLINRYTGAAYPEMGPNMMWNTKYGHMGNMMGGISGMMGNWPTGPGGAMTITPEQARTNAQQWLDANLPGTTAADEVDAFYGYYGLHILRNGQVTGMLSVNGYTGQVWYHSWHGNLVRMQEFD